MIKKRPLEKEDYMLRENNWQFVANACMALADKYQLMKDREDSVTEEELKMLRYYEDIYERAYRLLHDIPKDDSWRAKILK